jgi:hypothetical protein
MKNDERADRLLSEGESIFNELKQSLEVKNWNLTIRRAQEVVELVLKGLLAQLGMDYPKVHFEAEYDEDEAINAAKGAEKVIKFGKSFIESVRGDEKQRR